MSASADERDQALGFDAGMDTFLPKPISVATLIELERNEMMKTSTSYIDKLEEFTPDYTPDGNELDVEKSLKKTVLAVCKQETSDTLLELLRNEGWSVTSVPDTLDGLEALQKRNWDVVLIDDDLPADGAIPFVSSFRDWERKFRVNRQRDVFLISNADIPSPRDANSAVQPPDGFNGVLCRPFSAADLDFLLHKNQKHTNDDMATSRMKIMSMN